MSIPMPDQSLSRREQWKRTTQLLSTLLRIYTLSWKQARWGLIGTALCRLLLAIIPLIHMYLVSRLVNAVTEVITAGAGLKNVLVILAIQTGLSIGSAAIRSLEQMIMAALKLRIQAHIEEQMAAKSTRLPLVYFDRPDYYDSFHRAMGSQHSLILFDNSFIVIQSALTVIGYFAVVISFHWLLAVGLLLFVIPSLLVNMRLGEQRFIQMLNQTAIARRVNYLYNLLIGREAAKEIRLFGLSSHLIDQWRSSFMLNAKQKLKLERKGITMNWGVDSFNSILSGALIVGLAWLGTKGRLSIGQYVALTEAFNAVNGQLMSISSNLTFMYQNVLYAQGLFTFLDTPEEGAKHPSDALPLSKPLHKGIDIRNLSFQYPNQPFPTLHQVNLHIPPGYKIAIVGDNGAGKSTLAKCILGLYSASEGAVEYDGVNILDLEPADLRKRVTAVFQDFVRYQSTVRDNIGFGALDRLQDNSWLEVAASKSGANEIIESLPEQFDTMLGPMFEGGRELSQGQWQKIAISRAYFRDAELVVLDEPTASMDPMTEAAVFENFLQIAEGKTTLLISHRLGICKAVDHIIVMKHGRIVEQGTHEELLRLGGEYEQMYQVQSKWYDSEIVTV
ncbi:ATP-binding cassette subfamily B protein [Paenibacillus cellulosilyticus]|uniref:ATP-binding cassette subfamily B protein n=1 Tax=Paenibacillus cellulosilyticus TaxID=375489 RepID=A0A2V2Z1L5_9BACL|nr:ABC transporter ATP-binding protein [Paenibacillus cellulosilyticus]PWW07441.1 ATP-binding cassette subfamily B protein [Paenibacillus cellulosilyticus]QKS44400.1 ABC transporter ATP-binding protein [Paenibacillus cellulosilyticus]